MPGSFLILDRHWGFYKSIRAVSIDRINHSGYTFFASFLCFFCFDEDAFSILALSRVDVRFEFLPVEASLAIWMQ